MSAWRRSISSTKKVEPASGSRAAVVVLLPIRASALIRVQKRCLFAPTASPDRTGAQHFPEYP